MTYTARQRAAIAAHYPHLTGLRYLKDGRIYARKAPTGPQTLLYTAGQARALLKACGLLAA